MRFCTECGAQVSEDARFCTFCGKELEPMDDVSVDETVQPSQPQPIPQNQQPASPQKIQAAPPTAMPTRQFATVAEQSQGKASKLMLPFQDKFMGAYLFLALFFLNAGKDLFCSLKMMRMQDFLTDAQVASGALKGMICFCLLALMTGLCMTAEKTNFPKAVGKTLIAMLPLVFASAVTIFLGDWVSDYEHLDVTVLGRSLIGAVYLLDLFIIVAFVYGMVSNISLPGCQGVVRSMLSVLGMPVKLIGWMVGSIFVLLLPICSVLAASFLNGGVRDSFAANMAGWILMAVVETILVKMILGSMAKSAKKKRERRIQKGKNVSEQIDVKYAFLNVALAVVGGVLLLISQKVTTPSDLELIQNTIDEKLAESSTSMFMGSITDAYLTADEAQTYISAWEKYLDGERWELSRMTTNWSENAIVWRLYIELEKNVDQLETYVLTKNPYDPDINRVLLYGYNEFVEDEELSKKQKAFRQDIVQECIGEGIYTLNMPNVPKEEDDKKEFRKMLDEKYGYIEGCRDALKVLESAGGFGLKQYNLLNRLLNIADENPDVSALQYLAGVAGASAAEDNAIHYDQAIGCLERFVKLAEDDDEISESELQIRMLSAAKLICQMKGYEKALGILEKIDAGGDADLQQIIDLQRMNCYDRSGNAEQCYNIAVKLLNQGVEDQEVFYFCGVGAAKQSDRENTIAALERYAAYLQGMDAGDTRFLSAQASFHVLAQYASMHQSDSWVDYGYDFYGNMSDEEKDALSPFVHQYLEMLNAYYNRKDYESASNAAQALIQIRDDLAYPYYMLGIVGYDTKEYQASREAYEKAVELYEDNATFLYGLAYTCDAMEDYETAYAASMRCKLLMPTVNHETDRYGLGYHNARLLERIEAKMKTEVTE